MSMHIELLQAEHRQVRELLGECECCTAEELPGVLRRLRLALEPLLRHEEVLYEEALQGCRRRADAYGMALLNIFRTSTSVVLGAAEGFLQSPGTLFEQTKQRLRAVADSLRSALEAEERVVFPLYEKARQSQAPNAGMSREVVR